MSVGGQGEERTAAATSQRHREPEESVGRTDDRVDVVDRRLLLMGVPGLAALLLAGLALPLEAGTAPGAWAAAAVAVTVLLVAIVPAAYLAPAALPRAMLRVTAVLGLVVCAWWAFARDPRAAELVPWLWWAGPAVAASTTLLWSPRAGFVLILLWAAVVPLALLLADGSVSRTVMALAATHSSDVVFVGLYVVLRGQMRSRIALADAAAEQEARRLEQQAWSVEQSRVTALVHDEVLSALVAVALVPDHEVRAVRDQAARAVLRVDAEIDRLGAVVGGDVELVAAAELVTGLRAVCRELDTPVRLAPGGDVDLLLPRPAVDTLLGATAEALRNAVRHAADAPRTVRVVASPDSLLIRVHDEGPGFDLQAVPANRLGVRVSILGRLGAVPGCFGDVGSAPGGGTTVTLGWRRP